MKELRKTSIVYLITMVCSVNSEVQTWTAWYNTDKPTSDGEDDESLDAIQQRGYEACSGSYPIDAICREAVNHTLTFTSKTRALASDYFLLPCTTKGLVCRDVDQLNGTCRDYEVKFQCKAIDDSAVQSESMIIIIISACLSIILPLACITAMQCYRRRHQIRRQPPTNQVVEQFAQTESLDLPPSYSVLFGEGVLGAQAVTLSRTSGLSVTLSTSEREIEIPLSRRASTLERIPEHEALPRFSLDSGRFDNLQQSPNRSRLSNAWRRRFPNLRLSIFDMFSQADTQSVPSSTSSTSSTSTFSYICTPPPSYQDAIIITGGKDICLQIPSGSNLQEPIRILEIPDNIILDQSGGTALENTDREAALNETVARENRSGENYENTVSDDSEPHEWNTKL